MKKCEITIYKLLRDEVEMLPAGHPVLVANTISESIRIVSANKLPKKREYYNYFIFDLPASMQK